MPNRLWNVLTFTNIAAGASSAQAHSLNIHGTGETPDFGWVNNAAFSVTADATNVTVTNDSPAAATVEVLVCVNHSIVREYGGTGVPDLSPKPYWLIGSGQGGGSSGTTVQRYTCTGAEGSDFNVTLTVARASDTYSVFPTLAGVTSVFGIDCPDTLAGDRTTLQFRVLTTGAVTAGDIIDFLLTDR